MSETKNYLSFDELLAEPDTRYLDVKTKRGLVKMATASSAEVLTWYEENEAKEGFSGLRLLARCMLGQSGERLGDGLPNDERKALRAEFVRKMSMRDNIENGVLIRKCLELNGLRKPSDTTVESSLGNVSGETATVVSPSDSPRPSAE